MLCLNVIFSLLHLSFESLLPCFSGFIILCDHLIKLCIFLLNVFLHSSLLLGYLSCNLLCSQSCLHLSKFCWILFLFHFIFKFLCNTFCFSFGSRSGSSFGLSLVSLGFCDGCFLCFTGNLGCFCHFLLVSFLGLSLNFFSLLSLFGYLVLSFSDSGNLGTEFIQSLVDWIKFLIDGVQFGLLGWGWSTCIGGGWECSISTFNSSGSSSDSWSSWFATCTWSGCSCASNNGWLADWLD